MPEKANDTPAFFNFFVEKKVSDKILAKDAEAKLEGVYQILKDQLRRAKTDLLDLRKRKEHNRKDAEMIKIQIKHAQDRA